MAAGRDWRWRALARLWRARGRLRRYTRKRSRRRRRPLHAAELSSFESEYMRVATYKKRDAYDHLFRLQRMYEERCNYPGLLRRGSRIFDCGQLPCPPYGLAATPGWIGTN